MTIIATSVLVYLVDSMASVLTDSWMPQSSLSIQTAVAGLITLNT